MGAGENEDRVPLRDFSFREGFDDASISIFLIGAWYTYIDRNRFLSRLPEAQFTLTFQTKCYAFVSVSLADKYERNLTILTMSTAAFRQLKVTVRYNRIQLHLRTTGIYNPWVPPLRDASFVKHPWLGIWKWFSQNYFSIQGHCIFYRHFTNLVQPST